MRKIIFSILFLILVWPISAFAANVYVGPSAMGNGSGSDTNNLIAWSSVASSFVRGNTYHLQGGTYTGNATMSTADSGATWIYIVADSPVTFSSAVFNITTDYWSIDGVTGGGPGSWTSGHGILFTSPSCSNLSYISFASGMDHLIVKHCKFTEVDGGGQTITTCTGCGGAGPSADPIYQDTGNFTNSYFGFNDFDHLTGNPFVLRNGSGNIIEYNYTGTVGGASTCYANFHTEVMVFWAMSELDIRYNFFNECVDSGCIVRNGNSGTYSDNVRIYGNITNGGSKHIVANDGYNDNWRIFNNTFLNPGTYPIAPTSSQLFTYIGDNNIVYQSSSSTGFPYTGSYNTDFAISACYGDSWGYGRGNTSDLGIIINQPGGSDTVDPAYNYNPFVSAGTGNYKLAAPGIAGTNVTTVATGAGDATIPSQYGIDMLGNPRSTWSRGALEYTTPQIFVPWVH